MFCIKCGDNISDENYFCPRCGFKTKGRTEGTSRPDENLNKKGKASYFRTSIVGIISVVLVLAILFFAYEKLKGVDSPVLKGAASQKAGKSAVVSGTGISGAKVLFYVNDAYFEDVISDENGSFNKEIIFTKEGENVVTVKQMLDGKTSNFSNPLVFDIDITPPSPNNFKVSTEIPKTVTVGNFEIKGIATPRVKVLLNNNEVEADSSGNFAFSYLFQDGDNRLIFTLKDEFGNETEPLADFNSYADVTAPKIENFLCDGNGVFEKKQSKPTEEIVCVDIGQWQGILPHVSIPITGKVVGNVKSVTVDGKAINWDEQGRVYQRVGLYVYDGLNKYKVVAEDNYGNKSSGYIETTAADVNDTQNVNLNLNQ